MLINDCLSLPLNKTMTVATVFALCVLVQSLPLGKFTENYTAVVGAVQVSVTWQFDGPLFICLPITNIYCSHPSLPTWFRLHSKRRLHTCCRGQCNSFECKEFLQATIPVIMSLVCFTKENYNKPIHSCFVGKFFESAFCCGVCVSTLPLHEISRSHFISYPPVPGTHECLHAKVCMAFPHNNN